MVLVRVDWIFSAIRVSLFCTRRIWGPICREIIRVSSRSWIFFSNRSQKAAMSLAAWLSAASPVCCAFSIICGSTCSRTFCSFFLPARMYIPNSL